MYLVGTGRPRAVEDSPDLARVPGGGLGFGAIAAFGQRRTRMSEPVLYRQVIRVRPALTCTAPAEPARAKVFRSTHVMKAPAIPPRLSRGANTSATRIDRSTARLCTTPSRLSAGPIVSSTRFPRRSLTAQGQPLADAGRTHLFYGYRLVTENGSFTDMGRTVAYHLAEQQLQEKLPDESILQRLHEITPLGPDSLVLDVGGGTGKHCNA